MAMDHDVLLPLQTQGNPAPLTGDKEEQNMATTGDVEPTPSCSHPGSTKEIEYDFKPKPSKGADVGDDISDDDERDCIKFTPSIPSRPQIDLKGREVIFAIASFFLISVCIGLIVILATMQMQNKTVETNGEVDAMCLTKECLTTTSYLLDMMDQTVDPCQDFYQYVCGGWMASNAIPSTQSSWSIDSVIIRDRDQKLRNILESPIETSHRDSSEQKSKILYQTCMDVDSIDNADIEPLMVAINSYGGLAVKENWNSRNFDFQSALEDLHFTYWTDAFFTFWVAPDDKATHRNILQFDQAGLRMSDRSYYFRDSSDPIVAAYKKYMKTIVKLFDATDDEADQFVTSTFNFEKKLAEITVSEDAMERNDPELSYNNLTIRSLQQLSPAVKWLKFLQHNFTSVTTNTQVLITSKDYFRGISKLIRSTDAKTLNRYMIWRLVSNFAMELSRPYRKAAQEFDAAQKGSKSHSVERWKVCLETVIDRMGLAVSSLFIKKYFMHDSKVEVEHIIKTIRQQFKQRLEEIEWMTNATKPEALKKLNAMTFKIGYPDFLENSTRVDEYYKEFNISSSDSYFQINLNGIQYEIWYMIENLRKGHTEDDWGMVPHEVNAFYSPMENLMVFPAGILQPPYFTFNVPYYVNYGGIGATIGHEIIHGFDDYGSHFDSNGNLRGWWSSQSWAHFKNRTKCIQEYYNTFEVNGVPVNGNRTVGENTADIGGLRQSYYAYKAREKKEKGEQKTLPGLKLTNDQIFFVSYGQNWCSLKTKERLEANMKSSDHAPGEVRVRAALSQVPEFAAAFKCKAGTPMNPEKRCEVW